MKLYNKRWLQFSHCELSIYMNNIPATCAYGVSISHWYDIPWKTVASKKEANEPRVPSCYDDVVTAIVFWSPYDDQSACYMGENGSEKVVNKYQYSWTITFLENSDFVTSFYEVGVKLTLTMLNMVRNVWVILRQLLQ